MREFSESEQLWHHLFLQKGLRWRPVGWACDEANNQEAASSPASWREAYIESSHFHPNVAPACMGIGLQPKNSVFVQDEKDLEEAVTRQRSTEGHTTIIITRPGVYRCSLQLSRGSLTIQPGRDCPARSVHLVPKQQKEDNKDNNNNNNNNCLTVLGNSHLRIWGLTISAGMILCDGTNARLTLTECDVTNENANAVGTLNGGYATLQRCDVRSSAQAFAGRGELHSCRLVSMENQACGAQARAVVKFGGDECRVVN
jgi:hypothetical protein